MKVADMLLRRIGVTRERKDRECAEICNMNATITWNIKYFYIGMNNGGRNVWVGNVAGMVETRNASLYLGNLRGKTVNVLLKWIGLMWLETETSNVPL